MAKKINFVIILALSAMMTALSSCGSLGNYIGSGTLAGVASDYIIGATGQRGGIVGDIIEGASGSWYDEASRCTISVTSRANWYTVTDRYGVANAYYLMPLNEAIKGLPRGVQVMSVNPKMCRPYFVSVHNVLGWEIPTNRGRYVVSSYGYFPLH